MALAWFRQPSADDPGTLNLAYNAVDLPVIRGRAADPAVIGPEPLDFAGLLELVGAVGGAFRGLGVVPGSVVAAEVSDAHVELLTFLAAARLGAVYAVLPHAPVDGLPDPHLLVTDRTPAFDGPAPASVLLVGPDPVDEQRDLAWEVALRAGRTDPAGCAPVTPGTTAYVLDTAVPLGPEPASDRLGAIVATLSAGRPVDLTAEVTS